MAVVLYGYRVRGIPTTTNHTIRNKAGTRRLLRYTKKHTFFVAATYFFVSAYWQSGPIKEYIRKARGGNGRVFNQVVIQFASVIVAHVALLALGIGLHGVQTGILVYLFGFGIPSGFALWSMMFTNYIQHVHCDPWSPDNHSRNFVSKFSNWFVFQAGYHTVHHENPGTHWSKYGELHAARGHLIAPELNEHSVMSSCIRTTCSGCSPKSTAPAGRVGPFDPPGEQRLDLRTAEVSAVEVGVTRP